MSAPLGTPPAATQAPPLRLRFTRRLITIFLLALLASFTIGPLLQRTRSYLARRCTDQAAAHIARADWGAAVQALYQASQWQPGHPRLLRVQADFLIGTDSDPANLLHTLRQLDAIGQASAEDHARMGHLLIRQGEAAAARAVYENIPAPGQATRLAQELLANLLRQEGRIIEARQVMRRALSQAPDDPDCRLRLAYLEYETTAYSEMHQRARAIIWQAARSTQNLKSMFSAIHFLALDPQLTLSEAYELLDILQQQPTFPAHVRYRILSALLRLRPENRAQVIAAETARLQGGSIEALLPCLEWLLREREGARVLQLLPGDLFRKSPALLNAALQAREILERWVEMEALLARPAGLPATPAFINLWRARAARHQTSADSARISQLLATAFDAAGQGQDSTTAIQVAREAEAAGLWEIAIQFYEGLAKALPSSRVQMLEKVLEISQRNHNTIAVLDSARRIAALQPNNRRLLHRVIYLHILSGQDIELGLEQVRRLPPVQDAEGTTVLRLFQALCAYRLGDFATMRLHLATFTDTSTLTPGQRAVHAGLLSLTGQVGPAYRVAEKIPKTLLLPEELRFLKRAL